MRVGSIVETVGSFEHVRKIWSFPYPKSGDVLTVLSITEHPSKEIREKGIMLLYFEELPPSMPGLCDKQISGKPNFIELLLPDDINELLKEPILNKTDILNG